jgi:CelD/BcsL family acetyltransferase involved in cellulose biosynthesis
MTANRPRSFRTLTLLDAFDPRVESTWRTLEAAARPAYFLTWGWIESWLAELPREVLPQLAVISEGDVAIGACFLGRHRVLRHGIVPVRGLYLNTTGIRRFDELCIEHNGVLCRPGTPWPLAELVALMPSGWDELHLPAIDGDAMDPLTIGPDYQVLVDRTVPAPFVDLSRVRAADYLSLLSPNTRSQIRRARKAVGRCELEVARSTAHALEIFGDMVARHTASWRERGEPGAFADPWFERFHRRLIVRRFGHGEIELLRLRAGETTIGCIYNLIANGRVLFYQSGLTAFADPHVKPGYLCQAAAIEHAAAEGRAIYDLLGSSARYKQSLSTEAAQLVWVRVQRRLARFSIEGQAQRWKRAYEAWRATWHRAERPAAARSSDLRTDAPRPTATARDR